MRLPNGQFNPYFADFAAHFGFTIKAHRPYRPRTKGKVERMVDYLKDNFLNGRTFAGYEDLAQQGRLWQIEANGRVHATTGSRPQDLWQRENLTPLSGLAPYVLTQRHPRRVDVEGYVRVGNVRYSVPPEHVGKAVLVVQDEQRIRVRLGEVVIAEHQPAPAGACVTQEEHIEAMRRLTLAQIGAPQAHVTFTDANAVSVPPLSFYEEVAS